jgi:nitrate reductase NapD
VNKELHIAGVLVHGKVDLLTAIRGEIAALPGAEVHGASDDGKLVVTLEMRDSTAVLDHINAINQIRGVISATLVYQHNESLDSMQEELVYENHAP